MMSSFQGYNFLEPSTSMIVWWRDLFRKLMFNWHSKTLNLSQLWLPIVACFTIGIVGLLTVLYLFSLWRRKISLSWMKMIARSKRKNFERNHKVPTAEHVWSVESLLRAKGLKCCVCLESISPAQPLGQMITSENMVHRCDVCGAAAHIICSSNSQKDCKCVSMFGSKHVVHQWTVLWTDIADQSEEAQYCSYCEEPCSGSFLGGPPIYCCMWCQRLVHVDCHSSMATETGDICDLGANFRLEVKKIPSLAPCAKALLDGPFPACGNGKPRQRRPGLRATASRPGTGPGNGPHGDLSKCRGGARVRGFSRLGN